MIERRGAHSGRAASRRGVRGAPRLVLVGLALAFLAAGCGGGSGSGPSGADYVLAPEQPHYGATFAVWSQRWWQWAYELPRTDHPLFDPVGDDVAVGQVDPVWFIGGTFCSLFEPCDTSVERSVTIPGGTPLFFPIVNVSWTNQECVDPDTTYSYTELRGFAAGAIEAAQDVYCDVDGTRVLHAPAFEQAVRFRAQAEQFAYVLPADNVFVSICGDPAAVTLHDPVAGDGIWMMLRPLPPGQHELRFGGNFPTMGFSLDVVYQVTVLP